MILGYKCTQKSPSFKKEGNFKILDNSSLAKKSKVSENKEKNLKNHI